MSRGNVLNCSSTAEIVIADPGSINGIEVEVGIPWYRSRVALPGNGRPGEHSKCTYSSVLHKRMLYFFVANVLPSFFCLFSLGFGFFAVLSGLLQALEEEVAIRIFILRSDG